MSATIQRDLTWMDAAVCRTMPDWHTETEYVQVQACQTCPVRAECLEYGLSFGLNYLRLSDVYGGLNGPQLAVEAQRRLGFGSRSRRPPAPQSYAPCGTYSAYRRHERNAEECDICDAAMRERQARRMELVERSRHATVAHRAQERIDLVQDYLRLGRPPSEVTARLGISAHGLSTWLYRHDQPDLARVFRAEHERERKRGRRDPAA